MTEQVALEHGKVSGSTANVIAEYRHLEVEVSAVVVVENDEQSPNLASDSVAVTC